VLVDETGIPHRELEVRARKGESEAEAVDGLAEHQSREIALVEPAQFEGEKRGIQLRGREGTRDGQFLDVGVEFRRIGGHGRAQRCIETIGFAMGRKPERKRVFLEEIRFVLLRDRGFIADGSSEIREDGNGAERHEQDECRENLGGSHDRSSFQERTIPRIRRTSSPETLRYGVGRSVTNPR